jgi:hypothetical protein
MIQIVEPLEVAVPVAKDLILIREVLLVKRLTVQVVQDSNLIYWVQIIIGQAVAAAVHITDKPADTVVLVAVAVAVQDIQVAAEQLVPVAEVHTTQAPLQIQVVDGAAMAAPIREVVVAALAGLPAVQVLVDQA